MQAHDINGIWEHDTVHVTGDGWFMHVTCTVTAMSSEELSIKCSKNQ